MKREQVTRRPSGRVRAWAVAPIMALALLCSAPDLSIAQEKYDTYLARFIYNMLMLVTLPDTSFDSQKAPFTICVVERPGLAKAFEGVANNGAIKGRALHVQEAASGVKETCHALFVGDPDSQAGMAATGAEKAKGTLVMGDSPGFANKGGVINFVSLRGKIRFEINIDAAKRRGLRISSELLKLSIIVRDHEEVS